MSGSRAAVRRDALPACGLAALVVTAVLLAGGSGTWLGADPPSRHATPVPEATPSPAGVLPLPGPGDVSAEFLDDGTPVFVVTDERLDAPVVLDAQSTHRIEGFRKLVAWCRRAGIFEESLHGSRWLADGAYLGGPAATGLPAYETSVAGGLVTVGPRLPAPPRPQRLLPGPGDGDPGDDVDAEIGSLAPRGPSCMGSPDPSVFVSHYEAGPATLTPEEAVASAAPGVVAVAGVLERHPDAARMCTEPESAIGRGPSCGPDDPAVLGWGVGGEGAGGHAVAGVFLVVVEGDALVVDTVTGPVREWLYRAGPRD